MRLGAELLSTVVAMVAATASGIAQPPGPPKVDPCSLVTTNEAERLVGPLKGAPRSETVERAKLCTFEFADGKNAAEIWVFPASGIDRIKSSGKTLVPALEIGPDVYAYRRTDIGYLDMYAKKGEVTVQVSIKSPPGTRPTLNALVRAALGRL